MAALLVDAVVSEVHAEIVQLDRARVLLRRKPGHPLLVDVDLEWVE